jgi:hypothetical protein
MWKVFSFGLVLVLACSLIGCGGKKDDKKDDEKKGEKKKKEDSKKEDEKKEDSKKEDEGDKPTTAEGAMKSMISTVNDLAEALEGIKDEDSAGKAVPKVEKIATKMGEISGEMQKLKPAKDEEKALKEKYQKPLEKAMERYTKALVPAMTKAGKHAKALSEAMKKAQPKKEK